MRIFRARPITVVRESAGAGIGRFPELRKLSAVPGDSGNRAHGGAN
jgi:hypothetical protein